MCMSCKRMSRQDVQAAQPKGESVLHIHTRLAFLEGLLLLSVFVSTAVQVACIHWY